MTNAQAHRSIYSKANGGLAHLSNDALWQLLVQARQSGQHETIDQAAREIARRQRNADQFTSRVEHAVVLVGLAVVAAGAGLLCLGLWKLWELCF